MKPTMMKSTPKKLKLSLKKLTVAALGANHLDKVVGGLKTDQTCTFCEKHP